MIFRPEDFYQQPVASPRNYQHPLPQQQQQYNQFAHYPIEKFTLWLKKLFVGLAAFLYPAEASTPNALVQNIMEGDAGARETLGHMKKVATSYPCRFVWIATTQKTLAGATSDTEKINRIYSWITSMISYQADPKDEEQIKSPCRILNEVKGSGKATGDCDDFAVSFAAALKEAGIPAGFRAVANQRSNGSPAPLDHVFAIAFDRNKKQWVGLDPVAPGKDWTGHRWMDLVL